MLLDVVVREYNFEKYLSYTSQSMHKLADDLEEVDDGDSDGTTDGNDEYGQVVKGEVAAVLSATEYLSCRLSIQSNTDKYCGGGGWAQHCGAAVDSPTERVSLQ